jgi:2-keto-3-deoxy-L-rhamnonate aldolase RhmA
MPLSGICVFTPGMEEKAACIDVLFAGPGDWLFLWGQAPGPPKHAAAVTRILNAAALGGVPTGISCSSPAQVEKYAAEGVRLFLIGADVVFLAEGAGRLKSARAAIAAAALVSAKGAN